MNTNMMTKEVLDQIRSHSEKALSELQSGKSAVEVAQQMYMERLPNKDEEISRMMAQKMNELVKAFYQNWAAAQEDYDVWCESFLNDQIKDMTRSEACAKLNRMYCALTLIGAVRGAKSEMEAQEIREEMEKRAQQEFTEADATEEKYAQLRAKVREALMDSGIAADQLKELGAILETADAQLPLALNFGSRNTDVMTVLAMQAYLDTKDGLYEAVPVDTTMEHVVCSVCSTACALDIAAKVESGAISESAGCILMRILGAVAGGFLLVKLGYMVGVTLGYILSALFNPFIGVTVAAVTLFALAHTFFSPTIKSGAEAGEIVYILGGALLRGVKRLTTRLFAWIKPAAERCIARVKEAIAQRQAARASVQQTEMVPQ